MKHINKPGPWRITFDTNPDICNYKCIMCECFSPYSDVQKKRIEKGEKKKSMDISLIRKILEESVGTPLREIIPSTMGEPLLYKDFDEIIKLCHQHKLKLNLTTNGSFPIKGVEKWSELLMPVLSDIKISWNGASKNTNNQIMLFSKWENMHSNLTKFLSIREQHTIDGKNRPTVTLQMTFLESNYKELLDLVKMAISLNIDRIKGHHLWAHFDEIKDLSMRRNHDAIKRWNAEVVKAQNYANNNPLKNSKTIKLENITILSDNATEDIAPNAICPFLGHEAWVNTEGKFSPCCAPDELRKSLGDFGNLKNKTMQDIWQSDEYKDLKKNYMKHSLCKSCNMRKPSQDVQAFL
tara:strand:+ start:18240 stop:19295 length:1056 start_codon:yes stop_codon:yes gene_type:complete